MNRLRFTSILSRIVWLQLLAAAAVAVAVSSAAYLLLELTVNHLEERILRDRAEVVANSLSFADGAWISSLPPDLQASYSQGTAGFTLSITDAGGNVLYSSLPDGAALFPASMTAERFLKEASGGAGYYALNLPVRRDGATAFVQIAQNQENPDVIVDDVAAGFLARIIFVVTPVLALLLILDILIVRGALRPIRAASHIASTIHATDLDIRLPVADMPREALPLVTAVNQALDRLKHAFELQSSFIGDAAHELRTPLTVLRTQADMLADREAGAVLQLHIDAMSRIVDQLLDLAELEALPSASGERVDLNVVCAEVVAAMAPIALARNRAVGLSSAPAPVWISGNFAMLFRAVRNLVDNAIRYTDARTSVDVEVSADGVITVSDCGPGVPPQEREIIFQRFWRKDRKDRHHSGLGLSIVAQVARLHGARLDVTDRAPHGAAFRMIFPRGVEDVTHG